MSEEFGNDFLTIVDEEGNEFEFEHIDSFEFENAVYHALLPADMDEDDEDFGVVILKALEENGEEILVTVDDEGELDRAYDYYMQLIFDDSEE